MRLSRIHSKIIL